MGNQISTSFGFVATETQVIEKRLHALELIKTALSGEDVIDVCSDLLWISTKSKGDEVIQNDLLDKTSSPPLMKALGDKARRDGYFSATIKHLSHLGEGLMDKTHLKMLRNIGIYSGLTNGLVLVPAQHPHHSVAWTTKQAESTVSDGSAPKFAVEYQNDHAHLVDLFLDTVQVQLQEDDHVVEYSSDLLPKDIHDGLIGGEKVSAGEQCIVLTVTNVEDEVIAMAQRLSDKSRFAVVLQLAQSNSMAMSPAPSTASSAYKSIASTISEESTLASIPDISSEMATTGSDNDETAALSQEASSIEITYRAAHESSHKDLICQMGIEAVVELPSADPAIYQAPMSIRVWHDKVSGEGQVRVRSVAYCSEIPDYPGPEEKTDAVAALVCVDFYKRSLAAMQRATGKAVPNRPGQKQGRFSCRQLSICALQATPVADDVDTAWFRSLSIPSMFTEGDGRKKINPTPTSHMMRVHYQVRGTQGFDKRWKGCVEEIKMVIPNVASPSHMVSSIETKCDLSKDFSINDNIATEIRLRIDLSDFLRDIYTAKPTEYQVVRGCHQIASEINQSVPVVEGPKASKTEVCHKSDQLVVSSMKRPGLLYI